jgi:hypothetical protein
MFPAAEANFSKQAKAGKGAWRLYNGNPLMQFALTDLADFAA